MIGIVLIAIIVAAIFYNLWQREKKKVHDATEECAKLKSDNLDLNEKLLSVFSSLNENEKKLRTTESELLEAKSQNEKLSKFQDIVDIHAEIERAKLEAQQITLDANTEAEAEKAAAKEDAKQLRAKAHATLQQAENEITVKISATNQEAKRIIKDAEDRAKNIAGEAYQIAGKAQELEKTAAAMRNIIEGYGNEYLKPTYSLLDELAEDFGFTEAGQKLKIARENSARMVKNRTAAVCDYVQVSRRDIAVDFVVDAFNGKVDSILSKTKKDNHGILEQKIKDAYQIVNSNGQAFRNAVITPEYLSARLEELKWAVIASELKAQAQEEQKKLREQLREEERARREYEKSIKDAAKEEEMLRKAMEKAQNQIETANEAKRAEYEAKLDELRQKLQEAEERGQRALSMAQQTKHGNVYIISNVGSFGQNVYKVGMTRRLDPLDRVKELGDASVPFPFDVHAIIESDDAPNLETVLHKKLALMQMNKVNPRKEFFKVQLSNIKALVENMGLQTSWTLEAQAAEYRETLAIEERMRNDPDAQRKWEEFAQKVSSDSAVLVNED